jgi:hypothetical protein
MIDLSLLTVNLTVNDYIICNPEVSACENNNEEAFLWNRGPYFVVLLLLLLLLCEGAA